MSGVDFAARHHFRIVWLEKRCHGFIVLLKKDVPVPKTASDFLAAWGPVVHYVPRLLRKQADGTHRMVRKLVKY